MGIVRIRLQRFGQIHKPFYRIVAAHSESPRDGKFLERLGNYNPVPDKDGTKEIRVNVERTRYWISVGAQPSDRVKWLLGKVGILPPAPIRPSDPEAFRVPRKVLKEIKKKKKEESAERIKVMIAKTKERRDARLAARGERREKKKQIKIAKELLKSTKDKKQTASSAV